VEFLFEVKKVFALKGRKPERRNHDTILLLPPLQGFGVLYLLRRALPYANAGCPVGAILVNIHFKTKTEFSSIMSIVAKLFLVCDFRLGTEKKFFCLWA
jgi:hypothetical protein